MTGTADNELTQVLASAVAGDDVAFARIVAAHHGEMHRICAFVCRDQAMAEDAVQAAWVIAWRKLDSVREPERLRPWLVTVAVNEAKQLMRKRKRRSEIEVVADASAEPGGVDPATGLDSMAVREAMAHLDPDDRALLAMRYVGGFDSTELAAAIGLSPPGTRARLSRLLARLRQDLTDA
ncbi:MAG: RNA polymerase sigma factor [Acidimicrobiia bacterium]